MIDRLRKYKHVFQTKVGPFVQNADGMQRAQMQAIAKTFEKPDTKEMQDMILEQLVVVPSREISAPLRQLQSIPVPGPVPDAAPLPAAEVDVSMAADSAGDAASAHADVSEAEGCA